MKLILVLSISAILANASFGADEPTPPHMLQPGKDYSLVFAEYAKMSIIPPVRVLSHPQNGWVRIEITPRLRVPGVAPGTPAKAGEKRQVWLNLAHIVTIRDWD